MDNKVEVYVPPNCEEDTDDKDVVYRDWYPIVGFP
jgi:hypothetical protein